MRDSISLDGEWQFQLDPTGKLPLEAIPSWRAIQVPGPWQSQFDDLRLAAGVGWYRRMIDAPEDWAERTVFLRFGAADYYAEAWINGQRAGEHEGGYLPFEFDVSDLLRYGGENEIIVRVVDPGPGEADIFPDYPFGEIPHGKQSWYGPIGGLWQSVNLEARAPRYIRQVHVTPDGLGGRVSAAITLAGRGNVDRLIVNCLSPDDRLVAAIDADLSPGERSEELTFVVPNPQIWAPDSPALYTLKVTLLNENEAVDEQRARFGIRTFEARDGKLWLNGRPFYLRGVLDQDYYPHTLYTPPSLDFLKEQIRQAKAMGLNCLRCHIKIADPRYLQAADEEGILVWAEVPSWRDHTDGAQRRARETFAGMVARDWNHPSIVIWTLVNEDWGPRIEHSAEARKWLKETVAWARTVDPTRPIVDNSACFHNFHVDTDINDFHFYAAMPENLEMWQEFVHEYAANPDWTHSPHGDAVKTGREPLIVSEFGNWGLPDIGQLKEAYGGQEPWWFDTGKNWKPNVVHPKGAEDRFRAAGLENVFGDWSGLSKAAQQAQCRALKQEIEVMRAEPAISGYVITEWTDLHWECNGLLDMAHNARLFAGDMAAMNADTMIVPRWERLAYWSGESVAIDVLVSHVGAAPLEKMTLRWSLVGLNIGGSFGPLAVRPGDVIPAGAITFEAPKVSEAAQAWLAFRLEASGGKVITQNSMPLSLLPADFRGAVGQPSVWADDPVVTAWLEAQGYGFDNDDGVRIAAGLSEKIVRHVQVGGQALVCVTEGAPLSGLQGVEVVERSRTPWDGNWASSFAWVRPGLTRLPGRYSHLIDFWWQGAYPRHVITGIPAEDTLAGLFVGWVHIPAALAAKVRVGEGTMLLTTFPLLPPDGSPARTVLLHDLIRAAD